MIMVIKMRWYIIHLGVELSCHGCETRSYTPSLLLLFLSSLLFFLFFCTLDLFRFLFSSCFSDLRLVYVHTWPSFVHLAICGKVTRYGGTLWIFSLDFTRLAQRRCSNI